LDEPIGVTREPVMGDQYLKESSLRSHLEIAEAIQESGWKAHPRKSAR
jgi:hypothetical protein